MTKLDETCAESNEPGNDDYQMLIIQSPRAPRAYDWDDWARGAVAFLRAHGWTTKRVGPVLHAMHPMMAE